MRFTFKKTLFAVLPLAGLLALPAVVSARDDGRREYHRELREARREYQQDLKRARRGYQHDLREARRDHYRHRYDRDCDDHRRGWRSRDRDDYRHGWHSRDRYGYSSSRPFSSGSPWWYNYQYR